MPKPRHKVEVTYKSENPAHPAEVEVLSFADAVAANAFARRQQKLPQVASAKYVGVEQ